MHILSKEGYDREIWENKMSFESLQIMKAAFVIYVYLICKIHMRFFKDNKIFISYIRGNEYSVATGYVCFNV